MCDGHTHNFDHTTVIPSLETAGAVSVDATLPNGNEVSRSFGYGTGNAPHFLVRKDVKHKLTALDPPPAPHVVALADAAAKASRGEISQVQLELAVKTFWAAHSATEIEAWCIYSHRTPQGDVVQEYTGWEGAYT
jgi:hypothetical protein